jgi:hypothetical protein
LLTVSAWAFFNPFFNPFTPTKLLLVIIDAGLLALISLLDIP